MRRATGIVVRSAWCVARAVRTTHHARRTTKSLGAALFLATLSLLASTARAEDISISTYYPSPRGVYQELRTTNNTYLATLAGNVGIGTTNSDRKLTVLGEVHIGDIAGNGLFLRGASTATQYNWQVGNNIVVNQGFEIIPSTAVGGTTFSTPAFVIKGDTGNVGIGTTSPSSKLYVSDSGGVASWAGTFKQAGAAAYGLSVDCTACTTATGYTLAAYTNVGTGLFVLNGGNVGIGTTDPASKLDVNGNVRVTPQSAAWAEGIQFYMPNTGTWGGLRWSRNRGNYDGNWAIGYSGNDSTDNLVFTTNNGGSQTDILSLTKTGNVGIGTTDPGAKLDVNGVGLFGGGAVAIGSNTNTGCNPTNSSIMLAGSHIWDACDGNLYLYPGGGPSYRVAVNNSNFTVSGNVGIGTTVPGEKLDVSGNIHATGTIRADSDARFKQDLQPLSGILPKLASLHSISYTPSALGQARGMAAGRQLGVLGQELERVFPELVSASGPEQYRSVDYSRLTVVLLEAVKEQQHEIARLQAEHEATVAKLEARLATLEAARTQEDFR